MKPQSPDPVWKETSIVLLDGVLLHLPEGTFSSRLARSRSLLAKRLT